jgi:hypothetical protein
LSPIRWDFTPCFLDVWVLIVGVFGLLGGIGAIVYLRRQTSQSVAKNWHFWAKLVGEFLLSNGVLGTRLRWDCGSRDENLKVKVDMIRARLH